MVTLAPPVPPVKSSAISQELPLYFIILPLDAPVTSTSVNAPRVVGIVGGLINSIAVAPELTATYLPP